MAESSNIGILGVSHLSVVVSAALASFGYRIAAADIDDEAVAAPVIDRMVACEPGLQELRQANNSKLKMGTDISTAAACPIVIIAKDTPTDEETNTINLSVLDALVDAALPYFAERVEIIVMSQVPVGWTRSLATKIRRARPELFCTVVYCVETLIVGQAVERIMHPERMVLGVESLEAPAGFFESQILPHFHCPILRMRMESAELTKAAVNLFLATSVTFGNTLADLCDAVGADIREVLPALRRDARIGEQAYIAPGLGLSGGHLERDVAHLTRVAQAHGVSGDLLETITRQAEARASWLIKVVERTVFAHAPHPVIAVWGLAYKKNTDSLFRAPSIPFLRAMSGRATLRVYDPQARLPNDITAEQVINKMDAVRGADALLILSTWDEFADAPFTEVVTLLRRPIIIDGLGLLHTVLLPKEAQYIAMGVPEKV